MREGRRGGGGGEEEGRREEGRRRDEEEVVLRQLPTTTARPDCSAVEEKSRRQWGRRRRHIFALTGDGPGAGHDTSLSDGPALEQAQALLLLDADVPHHLQAPRQRRELRLQPARRRRGAAPAGAAPPSPSAGPGE